MVKLELGNYLKSAEVLELTKDGPAKIKFVTAGEYKDMKYEDSGDNKSVFHIEVELPDKEKRTWTPNYTTMKAIAKMYGDQTDQWVDKTVLIYTVKQKVFEKMRDVIYLSEDQEGEQGK